MSKKLVKQVGVAAVAAVVGFFAAGLRADVTRSELGVDIPPQSPGRASIDRMIGGQSYFAVGVIDHWQRENLASIADGDARLAEMKQKILHVGTAVGADTRYMDVGERWALVNDVSAPEVYLLAQDVLQSNENLLMITSDVRAVLEAGQWQDRSKEFADLIVLSAVASQPRVQDVIDQTILDAIDLRMKEMSADMGDTGFLMALQDDLVETIGAAMNTAPMAYEGALASFESMSACRAESRHSFAGSVFFSFAVSESNVQAPILCSNEDPDPAREQSPDTTPDL